MRFEVVLNRDGGTLRTLDLDGFANEVRATLEEAGHEVNIVETDGAGIDAALDAALEGECDVVMVGGGDGTVSAAAGRLKDSGKSLAVLPAGTMNLFARSLGVPLRLDEAVAAFALGRVRDVDLASANGKVFVHQFSIGLHAKLIRLRERHDFNSRPGKIWASLRAGLAAFFRPPRLRVTIEADGRKASVSTAGIGVTNNLFGEGHLPYTDTPDGGVLGVYVTRARRASDFVRFALHIIRGRWRDSSAVEVRCAREVVLTLRSPHRRFGCAIDGELCDLDQVTVLRIHPGALKVLVPAPA